MSTFIKAYRDLSLTYGSNERDFLQSGFCTYCDVIICRILDNKLSTSYSRKIFNFRDDFPNYFKIFFRDSPKAFSLISKFFQKHHSYFLLHYTHQLSDFLIFFPFSIGVVNLRLSCVSLRQTEIQKIIKWQNILKIIERIASWNFAACLVNTLYNSTCLSLF